MRKNLFLATTLLTFLSMTGIDFLVHFTLYHYGLRFSEGWAEPYWSVLTLSFLSISLLSSATYLMSGGGERRIAILIFLTIFGLFQAGLVDIMWILLWAAFSFEDLYILKNVWWWSPYYRFFSIEWRVEHQILLLAVTTLLLSLAWIK